MLGVVSSAARALPTLAWLRPSGERLTTKWILNRVLAFCARVCSDHFLAPEGQTRVTVLGPSRFLIVLGHSFFFFLLHFSLVLSFQPSLGDRLGSCNSPE
ncbi:hypothetical protein CEP54_003516 [Fusarium duplospermum]|uniref:Uncharacterized protein n=1 Tax=Fusarium duplospermum TaxID=1325734 RepID=A0A428QNU8_9HYPO|nr:hypothetical protein CEP54_003516 [Fusarium duplospermum]